MNSKKMYMCETLESWAVENTNLRDWVVYIGTSPQEINKASNQRNRNENEEMMVFRKV